MNLDSLVESRQGKAGSALTLHLLNKIITAATAVELHGNWCSLNHVGMNL